MMLTTSVGNAWPFGRRGGGKAVALKTESAGHESSRRASAAVPNSQLSRKGQILCYNNDRLNSTSLKQFPANWNGF